MMLRNLVALGFCLFAAACATPSDTISIAYFPSQGEERVSSVPRGEVYVTAWDARGMDPRTVAARYDKDGNEIGTIQSDKDVAEIFRDATERELQARGFDLSAGGRGAHVDIKVEKFFNRARTGIVSGNATADVALTATVTSVPQAPGYKRYVEVKGKKPSAMLVGGVNDRLALENGLADAIANLMDDRAFMAAIDEAARTNSR